MKQMEETKTIWICFRDAQFFIRHFTKKGFGHVYVLMRDEFNWMMLDPRNNSLHIELLPFNASEDVPTLIKKEMGHTILKIIVEDKIQKWPNLNPFYMVQCVNIVKYILGIKVFAFSPYGLYRYLIKMKRKNRYKKGIVEIEHVI